MKYKHFSIFVAVAFTGTAFAQTVDTVLLNATTNVVGEGDEAPGLSNNFLRSSAIGNVDDPEGAFGNNNGPIEPPTFIFDDGGVKDDGDNILGNNGETVYTLSWNTTSPVTLAGIELAFGGGEGGPAGNRGTQLYEFSIQGNIVAQGDANGSDIGQVLFGGDVFGDTFLLRITGTVNNPSAGPRVSEINAIVPVPEPTTFGLLGISALGLLARRRR